MVCVEHNIFSDDTQNVFLGISGKKLEILTQVNHFQNKSLKKCGLNGLKTKKL